MEQDNIKYIDVPLHEDNFNELLKSIKDDFEAGKITEDEKNIMIAKATLDESDKRKKEFELANKMFNYKVDDNSIIYYQRKIVSYIQELYISCKYNWYDLKKAWIDNYNYFVKHTKYNGVKARDNDKKIYDDLLAGKLDLLNTSGEELLVKYED